MNSFFPYLLVGAGGLCGSMARYLMSVLFREWLALPMGTLVSNLAGCLLIGMFTGLSADTARLSTETRLLLVSGFCGGFTTLSSLVYELGQQFRDGAYVTAALYLTGTLTGAMLAFFAGSALVKLVFKG